MVEIIDNYDGDPCEQIRSGTGHVIAPATYGFSLFDACLRVIGREREVVRFRDVVNESGSVQTFLPERTLTALPLPVGPQLQRGPPPDLEAFLVRCFKRIRVLHQQHMPCPLICADLRGYGYEYPTVAARDIAVRVLSRARGIERLAFYPMTH